MRLLKAKGGLRVNWQGAPTAQIEPLAAPSRLRLPLRTSRFHFGAVQVNDGDRVHAGQVLARAEQTWNVPLLAPLGGTVALERDDDKGVVAVCLNELDQREPARDTTPVPPPHVNEDGEHLALRQRFLEMGGWPLLRTHPGDHPPSPDLQPGGVLITCLATEPFRPQGSALLSGLFKEFALGLESIQKMLGGYEPIHLVVSDADMPLAQELRDLCRGYAWLQTHAISPVYPYDHPAVILQSLSVRAHPDDPWWVLNAQGVLAAHRVLVTHRPVLSTVIALAGPSVASPTHLRVYPGTPVGELLEGRLRDDADSRVIRGGVFTGRQADIATDSLDIEDDALTVLPGGVYRQFLGFMRPGLSEHSVTRSFLSSLLPGARRRMSTRLHGEARQCVQCSYCENVCPIQGLMPYLYHRYMPREMLDELEKAGIWSCIECGCCSYVCPSKIPLLAEIRQGRRAILEEQAEQEDQ